MNEYTPAYLAAIQNDLAAILAAAENAAEIIENSAEYSDYLHPYHPASVSTYNRICSTLIDLERIKTPE